MIKAVIFDFDGLILDTELPDYQSWQEIYQQHGCSLPLATWTQYIGLGSAANPFDAYAYLEAQLGRPIKRDEVRSLRRQRYGELTEAQPVLPGISDYIRDAQRLGLKIGLASSSSRAWVVGHLTRLNLHIHFDCIVCSDDVTQTKPHPELYLTALEKLHLQPDEAIALEDSPNGSQAARQAGIYCVAIPNPLTAPLTFNHADLRLTSLQDMPLKELINHVQSIHDKNPE